ncbi:DEAD/DEAH box helicase [Puniceicoccaceae bacterium K14]|nr:DEAD/DEAH box helicase [Puniceicoccaceae bacterium K14]
MTEELSDVPTFGEMGLSKAVTKALDKIGYERPSPIQASIIPHVLEGRDVIGQAQTGTGKTAAFALPLLSSLDLKQKEPQVLVLAPTRELAIQVSEAFQKYAALIKDFHVVPIYGGQDYGTQFRQLKRGAHVIVGTPGRVMDHIRRESLVLKKLKCLVLDEADEMLRMGFIDDVEWVMEQTPSDRQVALFSATMPGVIRKIAQTHLNDPKEITIKAKTRTADTIRQRHWMVSGAHKLDALTRVLEVEEFDGMIIFVRTKTATTELAEKLQARGFAAVAINGDIAQSKREQTIQRLKDGKLDILIATDVAARGLDVDRISHVVNYDIPYDTESYVHRIGRTGRAGRTGDAILFVSPRERRMLAAIERATKSKIELMDMPTTDTINNKRIEKFKQEISDTIGKNGLEKYVDILDQFRQEHDVPSIEIAAALAKMLEGNNPLLLDKDPVKERIGGKGYDRESRESRGGRERRGDRGDRGGDSSRRERPPQREPEPLEEGMQRYRVEVGHNDAVKPGSIVGAIANESGLEGKFIGRIAIYDDHSTVDLPEGMPKEIMRLLKKTWVANKQLGISVLNDSKSKKGKKPSFGDRPQKKKSFASKK